MKNITKILITSLTFVAASLHAQTNVTASYGSAFGGSEDGSTFSNAAGSVFSSSNAGVIAFGWSDGFSDTSSISSMLADFNVLGSLDFSSASAGYNPGSVSFDNDSVGAAGKEGYWMVLAGVSSFGSASSASEIGIFNDDDWAVAPVGSLTGDSWTTAQVGNVENVIFGNQVAGGGFGAGTQFQTAAVPEPSAYALLGGLLALGCVMLRRRA
jgi:hypothetical protein